MAATYDIHKGTVYHWVHALEKQANEITRNNAHLEFVVLYENEALKFKRETRHHYSQLAIAETVQLLGKHQNVQIHVRSPNIPNYGKIKFLHNGSLMMVYGMNGKKLTEIRLPPAQAPESK